MKPRDRHVDTESCVAFMQVEHIVFLIHPGCYEALPPDSPLHGSNIGIYIDREREVKGRWLASLDEYSRAAEGSVLLLQLYGPRSLFDAARARLSPASACYVEADFSSVPPGPHQLAEYYRRLTACIQEHLSRFDLTVDPAEVTSEVWGESFEGCAPCYSSAFAENLKLKQIPELRFEMTVYDSRFLFGAKPPEKIRLPGTDIEAHLFELYDQTSAAIFQARLSAQFYDHRPIHLALDPARVQLCTTLGFTVWPEERPLRAVPGEPVTYTLTTSDALWLRGIGMDVNDLRDVVKSAMVGTK